MPELSEHIALEVNGESVSLEEVIRIARRQQRLAFLHDAADSVLIRQAANQRGIEVSDEELQDAADRFRLQTGLLDLEATDRWLEERSLTFEDWETMLEEEIRLEKLRQQIAASRIELYFAENRFSFYTAALSRLVVANEDLARELHAQVMDDGADFHALAREHSIEAATRRAGGYAGQVPRASMPAEMESAVFGAREGDVLGPFRVGKAWQLIKVEEVHAPVLDEPTRQQISERVFQEWLAGERRRARITMPILVDHERPDENDSHREDNGEGNSPG